MPEPEPIAWRAVTSGTRMTTDDGTPIGTVREMLGSDAEDIFHGIRVRLTDQRRDVMIRADDVSAITTDGVRTGLSRPEIDALPPYDEVATYHLASVGWLRKHLGWAKDSRTDEEPG